MKHNKNIIKIAQKRIDLEIKRVGYIEDSDMIDRFLDNLAYELIDNENLSTSSNEVQDLLELIKEKCINGKYNKLYHTDKNSNYTGFYVPKNSKYKTIGDILKSFE